MPLPPNIAEAAARLVAQHGPDGFSMDDLAREAGLSRATLYRHAGGREVVLAALSETGVEVGKRLDIRERILAACRVVFTRAGFEAATLEEVAREAGVGNATVYRQFGDKAGLIAAFAGHFGPHDAIQEVALAPTGDLRADLERVAAIILRFALADLDLLKLGLMERMRGGPWGNLLHRVPMRGQAILARLLEFYAAGGALRSKDLRRMVQTLSGMLFAILGGPMLENEPLPDPDETARFIADVFLHGFATSEQKLP